jgi:hypothetical protein
LLLRFLLRNLLWFWWVYLCMLFVFVGTMVSIPFHLPIIPLDTVSFPGLCVI